jgi:thiosulfate/3-mercaptopyruvate sulfurtransferase
MNDNQLTLKLKIMKKYNVISLIVLFLLSGLGISAQVDIISAKDFMELRKNNKELVIIDANKSKNYAVNHIKDAIHINHNDLYQAGDIKGLIMDVEDLAAFFGEKGISEDSQVVVYDDGSHKYATRVYWVLKYLGATDVNILHKDMDAWRAARVPITATPASLEATTFTPTVNESVFTDIEYVKANKGLAGFVLVDCRTADEYNGVKNSEGYIPSAININYEEMLTESGAFKTADELAAIAESYGITADDEVMLYCRTSVRAAVAFVAFKNILGYEKVKVYDGAYLEWVANYPVE